MQEKVVLVTGATVLFATEGADRVALADRVDATVDGGGIRH